MALWCQSSDRSSANTILRIRLGILTGIFSGGMVTILPFTSATIDRPANLCSSSAARTPARTARSTRRRSEKISPIVLALAFTVIFLADCTPQNFIGNFLCCRERSRGNQACSEGPRIVQHLPISRQWPVKPEEVPQPSIISPPDDFLGHAVTASLDPASYALNGQVRTAKPKKEQAELVTGLKPAVDPRCRRSAGQCCLECETDSSLGKFLKSPQHDRTGLKGQGLLAKT